VDVPEVHRALEAGRLRADGTILRESGAALVTKVAIEPVWHLPGVARRFGCAEAELRRAPAAGRRRARTSRRPAG